MTVQAHILCAGFIALGGVGLAQSSPEFDFMPEGGKTTFVTAFGTDPKALPVLTETHSVEDWIDLIVATGADLDETAVQTLAGYLALNTPVEAASAADASTQDILQILPPDGRDLAIARCQFCHSFFTGYLMQKRDEAGWLSTFKSPFHKEIPMTEVERQTFASYSALNMPMKYEDVPSALRY